MEGDGGQIKENDRKITKGNFCEKKIVHTEKPRKNCCIDLPKYFTEILAMRTREQIGARNCAVITWRGGWETRGGA